MKFHWKLLRRMLPFTFLISVIRHLLLLSYEYQLEGEDTGWMALTGRSDITYYDLPSGNYTFKVRQMGNPESETQLTV